MKGFCKVVKTKDLVQVCSFCLNSILSLKLRPNMVSSVHHAGPAPTHNRPQLITGPNFDNDYRKEGRHHGGNNIRLRQAQDKTKRTKLGLKVIETSIFETFLASWFKEVLGGGTRRKNVKSKRYHWAKRHNM